MEKYGFALIGCGVWGAIHTRAYASSPSVRSVAAAADLHGKPAGFAVAAIEHFIDCVSEDRAPMVTGEDGLCAAEVVLAIEQSARTGIPVELRSEVPVHCQRHPKAPE